MGYLAISGTNAEELNSGKTSKFICETLLIQLGRSISDYKLAEAKHKKLAADLTYRVAFTHWLAVFGPHAIEIKESTESILLKGSICRAVKIAKENNVEIKDPLFIDSQFDSPEQLAELRRQFMESSTIFMIAEDLESRERYHALVQKFLNWTEENTKFK